MAFVDGLNPCGWCGGETCSVEELDEFQSAGGCGGCVGSGLIGHGVWFGFEVVFWLEVKVPKAVAMAFSFEHSLLAFVDDDGLFCESCYATMVTK